jgi:hypothetical protein
MPTDCTNPQALSDLSTYPLQAYEQLVHLPVLIPAFTMPLLTGTRIPVMLHPQPLRSHGLPLPRAFSFGTAEMIKSIIVGHFLTIIQKVLSTNKRASCCHSTILGHTCCIISTLMYCFALWFDDGRVFTSPIQCFPPGGITKSFALCPLTRLLLELLRAMKRQRGKGTCVFNILFCLTLF